MLEKSQNKKPIIFAIVNQKGGVGKTTTAVNLAAAFAKKGKKTLLIDMDPQGNASTGFGILQSQRQKTIYEIFTGEAEIEEAISPHKIKNLKIITSTVDLSACEIELVNIENREFILKEQIAKISSDFDFIIIDCPPSLGVLTINALAAATNILIPMQCEFFALEGLSHLLTTLELVKENLNENLKISGIVLTMHDRRNKLTEQVELDIREFLGDKVFKNIVPRNVRLSEAPSHGIPGILYDKKSSGAKAYLALAAEVLKKISS